MIFSFSRRCSRSGQRLRQRPCSSQGPAKKPNTNPPSNLLLSQSLSSPAHVISRSAEPPSVMSAHVARRRPDDAYSQRRPYTRTSGAYPINIPSAAKISTFVHRYRRLHQARPAAVISAAAYAAAAGAAVPASAIGFAAAVPARQHPIAHIQAFSTSIGLFPL